MRGSEFAELKAFVAVVERGSFARAADHLGLPASALSQTIRQLEARLGRAAAQSHDAKRRADDGRARASMSASRR